MEVKKKKINIIDILVIVLIVLAIAVVAIKLMGDKVQDAVDTKVDCWAEVCIENVDPMIYNEVFRQDLVGEKIVGGNAYLNATVEDVWIEDCIEQVYTADGAIVDAVNPTEKNLIILVHTTVSEGTASPKIGAQEIRAGMEYIAKTQTFASTGIIRYVQLGEYTNPYNH